MLKVITRHVNEEEKYSMRHILTDGDGPILHFDGEAYDQEMPLFFIPEKYRRTVFTRIHIRNAKFIPGEFNALVRYAGNIYVDNSVVIFKDRIPDKIIISNSLIFQKVGSNYHCNY